MKYEYIVYLPGHGGEKFVRRPMVEVEIFGPQGKRTDLALIDSGADRSIFNIEIAEILGIDLTNAEKRRTIGITGETEVFLAEVEVRMKHLEGKIKIPVGFIDSPSVGALLGQEGFFDQHRIKFERDHNSFEITPVKRKHA